jgi:Flp pilus assembly protein TadD
MSLGLAGDRLRLHATLLMKKLLVILACLAIVAASVIGFRLMHRRQEATTATNAYADPKSCIQCHGAETAGYATTGMARAFYRPERANTIDAPAKGREFFHVASGTYYSMTEHSGRYFQRRWQQGFDGKPDNVEELQIDFIMGSGNHVRTYLHREQDGTLTELPLAWYSETGGHWGMNPGYDNPKPVTHRPIAYECMFCHNAYPEIPATGHRDLAANPVYNDPLPEGIDCQRCHGPGANHVRVAQTSGSSLQEIRAAILNPVRLSKARQMEVCEQCHLETTSRSLPDRIRHYDQQPFGYRADQPLAGFSSYFSRDPEKGRTDNFEIVNAPYRLRQSQCYLKSGGALTCESCHNPHDLHKGPESAGYYASICMKCHAAALPAEIAAHRHPASNDCISCHMPRRRTEDVVHAVMTDHLIQRRSPPAKELLAERQEIAESPANAYHGEVMRYMLDGEGPAATDGLYDALAQVIDSSNLEAGVSRLQEAIRMQQPSQPNFSIELGDALRHIGDRAGAISAYRQALALDPLSSRGQRRLGSTLGDNGQEAEGLAVLKKALEREPTNALLWYEQGLIELRMGRRQEAIEHLREALRLKPDFADAQNNLGIALIQAGDKTGAEAAFRSALIANPYDVAARANLGRLLAGKGDWKQAAFQLQMAVQLEPADGNTHMAYSLMLLEMNRLTDAEKEAEAAVKADPNSVDARDLLAQIRAEKRDRR